MAVESTCETIADSTPSSEIKALWTVDSQDSQVMPPTFRVVVSEADTLPSMANPKEWGF